MFDLEDTVDNPMCSLSPHFFVFNPLCQVLSSDQFYTMLHYTSYVSTSLTHSIQSQIT